MIGLLRPDVSPHFSHMEFCFVSPVPLSLLGMVLLSLAPPAAANRLARRCKLSQRYGRGATPASQARFPQSVMRRSTRTTDRSFTLALSTGALGFGSSPGLRELVYFGGLTSCMWVSAATL